MRERERELYVYTFGMIIERKEREREREGERRREKEKQKETKQKSRKRMRKTRQKTRAVTAGNDDEKTKFLWSFAAFSLLTFSAICALSFLFCFFLSCPFCCCGILVGFWQLIFCPSNWAKLDNTPLPKKKEEKKIVVSFVWQNERTRSVYSFNPSLIFFLWNVIYWFCHPLTFSRFRIRSLTITQF